MKKVYGFLIGLVLSVNLFALEFAVGPKVSFGWTKGFGSFEAAGTTYRYDTASKMSTQIGGVFSLKVNDWFYVEPELVLHLGKGWEQYSVNEWIKIKYNVLELPILAKAKFDLGPGKIAAVLGPQIDIAVSRVNVDGDKISLDNCGWRRFSLSLVTGCEYELPLGPGDLVAGLRYAITLTDLAKSSNEKLRMYSILPTVAYMFKF